MNTYAIIISCVMLFAFQVNARLELDCSVFVYGANDWNYNGTSECIAAVDRVRQYCGGSKLQFYPTAHFIQVNAVPTTFCYKYQLDYVPITDTLVQEMAFGMSKCFEAAVSQGFTHIEITPHLDDGAQMGFWRNALVMNPLVQYNGYSYYDIMIKPLAYAINKVASSAIQIYMSMQGESNLMVITYPYEFLLLSRAAKCLVAGTTLPEANVKVGISLNYNKLMGMTYANASTTDMVNMPAIHDLFYGVDFLGMSSYPSTSTIPQLPQFSGAIPSLASELSFVGIVLADLLATQGYEFHFSEVGIGGGSNNFGNDTSTSFAQAVQTTYFGVFGDFNASTNPWQTPEMQSALTTWYSQFVVWATVQDTYQYPVTAVFIWSTASWDVCSIYHTDTNAMGTYGVASACDVVNNWNDKGVVPV